MAMWATTQTGFISAVAHRDDATLLMVRARDAQSLRPLVEQTGAAITATPNADYPYRVTVTRQQFADAMVAAVLQIDYSNFKSRVHTTRGHEFAHTLTRVWEVMHDVEDDNARAAGEEGGRR